MTCDATLRFLDKDGAPVDVRPSAVHADWFIIFGQRCARPLSKGARLQAAFPGGSETFVYDGRAPARKKAASKKAPAKK